MSIRGEFPNPEYPEDVEGVKLPIGGDDAKVAAVYEVTPPPSQQPMTLHEIYGVVNLQRPAAYYLDTIPRRLVNRDSVRVVDEIHVGTVAGIILRLWGRGYVEREEEGDGVGLYRRKGRSGSAFIGAVALLPNPGIGPAWSGA